MRISSFVKTITEIDLKSGRPPNMAASFEGMCAKAEIYLADFSLVRFFSSTGKEMNKSKARIDSQQAAQYTTAYIFHCWCLSSEPVQNNIKLVVKINSV